MKITDFFAREIFDSRGQPTIECEIILDGQFSLKTSVPSGLSKGPFEAFELRDQDSRYNGLGVKKAIAKIENLIIPELVSKAPDAIECDLMLISMDGTANKSNLGANTTLAVSQAIYKAQAFSENLELYEMVALLMGFSSVTLPYGLFNIINGGLHADNNLSIQEFIVVPVGANNFRESFEMAINIFNKLKTKIKKMGKSISFGDEGGLSLDLENDIKAIELIYQIIEELEYNERCVVALDIAAGQYYDDVTNTYNFKSGRFTSEQLLNFYKDIIARFPIYTMEDPFAPQDKASWQKLLAEYDGHLQVVGDDLTATNLYRITDAAQENLANSFIIKPNQIGTVTESLQAIKLCNELGLHNIVSHRSGDTCDTFIADLAVGANSGQIKAGGCSRSECVSKYNRLLSIEDKLTFSLLQSV